MRLLPGVSLAALVVFFSMACSAAEPIKTPMLSYQGFSGILNTPSAHVSDQGSIHLLYSDQIENIWRAEHIKRQGNYLMSVGLFSFFELGGRITDAPRSDGSLGVRDLSASCKVTSAPLTQEHPHWPVVAFGVQDVGGGANQLQSRYVVVSEDLWRFRFSGGYGFRSERMKGAFGGVEFQAHDWLTLLGEYDTRDTSAGIRLVTPEIWKTPIQVAGTLKSTLNYKPGNIAVAVGLTFPLDFRKKNPAAPENMPDDLRAAAQVEETRPPAAVSPSSAPAAAAPHPAGSAPVAGVPVTNAPAAGVGNSTNTVSSAVSANLEKLQRQLVKAGFTHVRAGQRAGRELVVEYENSMFNHNELDALGVVTGIVSELAEGHFETLHIVIKRNGIRMAVVSAPLTAVRGFMKQTGSGSPDLRDSLAFSYDTGIIEDTYFHPDEPGWIFPNTSLILGPGLQTFVATDVGVFDYLLSFRPELVSNLWKGGVFQARWDIPLVWSNNFDNGQPFRGSRNDARMDRAMLFQGLNLAPGIMANLGAGQILHNIYGTLNEISWSPGEGRHRLRGAQAWARNPDTRRTIDMYLGSYRYFHAPLDLSLEATAGRYWEQDRGFSLELKRFFSDTAVSAYYKNSTTAEGKHWQAAGIQFAIPLTPRKDLQVGPLQIRGTDEFAYAQETTLAIGGQTTNDVLTQALALNPQPTPALYRAYFNRDRLNRAYLLQHIDRLREAWRTFRADIF